MKVTVHLHSKLLVEPSAVKSRRVEVDLIKNSNVKVLIAQLELAVEADRLLIGINDEPAGLDDILHDGDHIHLILPVSGGEYFLVQKKEV